MDEQVLKESVFLFLHGDAVFIGEHWGKPLIAILQDVGFDAGSLAYSKDLIHYESCPSGTDTELYGMHLDSHLIPNPLPFGVIVYRASDSTLRDEDAEVWLNEVSQRIKLLRLSCHTAAPDKDPLDPLTDEEMRREQSSLEERIAIMTGAKKSIDGDPTTIRMYGVLKEESEESLAEFTGFFEQALEMLSELIEKSRAFKPILLTEDGDIFVQASPPGLHSKNLRDDMELQSGKHDVCGGRIDFLPTSSTSVSAICGKCFLRVRLAQSVVSTFTQLRYRGDLILHR